MLLVNCEFSNRQEILFVRWCTASTRQTVRLTLRLALASQHDSGSFDSTVLLGCSHAIAFTRISFTSWCPSCPGPEALRIFASLISQAKHPSKPSGARRCRSTLYHAPYQTILKSSSRKSLLCQVYLRLLYIVWWVVATGYGRILPSVSSCTRCLEEASGLQLD